VTGGVLVWLAVKAAMAVLAVLVPAIRGGPSVTDPAGLAVPDAADGFFRGAAPLGQRLLPGRRLRRVLPGRRGRLGAEFLPRLPAIARGVAEIITFGAPVDPALTVAMWLVSAVASVTAAVLLWRLVQEEYPPGVARWATVLLVTGPYSMFLFADHSESVFLAFAVAAWYCTVKHRWALVGVFAAAATFTRINGVFLVAALLVLYVQQRRRTGAPVIAAAVWWLPVACTGIAAYFGCDVPHRTRPAPWR